ncbi:MAG: LacI family DNA-binding transcriptional regulator [Balneola sp.]|nr:LacI family DNA-binding transcriptional regulator [Balneola sp.]MBO6652008.1 LacI family DNA-binding transcriptional regulator [Balneola sp.]MBO6711898.1 LacI family DNA-binding transcriptional regulator [Balneola sp.]MBO6800093.1 LacI family DNA-binding transcriptional regulator [Balneola sp.]MBO6871526.1 LacI family DNA-binding transcriptional regulator [Balneola sp.]
MRVTLKDIADKAGYSISTVSRVLNGSEKISEQVQKHIIKCAESLNYPFNKSAIPLYSNGSKSIILVTDFYEGEFYSSYFAGYSKAAKDLKVQLSLVSVSENADEVIDTISYHFQRKCDGIVLFIPSLERKDYTYIKNKLSEKEVDIPIVSNGLIENPILPTITFDGYSGGHIAAEHLHKKGYKKLGIVKGPPGKAESSFRYNGFIDYCHNKKIDVVWEFEGDFSFKSGLDAFYNLKEIKEKPDAVFCSSDLMAMGLYEGAREENIIIPSELAIISYDNLPMCEHVRPKFSSIETDFISLGNHSLKTLTELISPTNNITSSLSFIPTTLIEREST